MHVLSPQSPFAHTPAPSQHTQQHKRFPPQVFDPRSFEALLLRSIVPKLVQALRQLHIVPSNQARVRNVSIRAHATCVWMWM